jgi:hypothetical protein
MARIELNEIMTGLGLLGNALSIPRQVQGQQIQNEQMRMMLKDSGIPEEMITAATPEPSMRWLSAGQPGFGGKVLGGVGDVGSILTTVVGKPVTAPRMDIGDLASASRMRVAHQQAQAQKRLGEVILDPKSTPRDIAAASIEAGNTSDALRLLRPDSGGKPPASVLGLRSYINSLEPGDPRRDQAQRALDDQLAYQREQEELANRRIIERQPPHYTPEETEARRHGQIRKNRAADAADLGYKPGTPEYDYYMSYGHPRVERQPAPEPTFEEDAEKERRRRDAMMRDPLLRDKIPDEPVEDTVRRNRAAREKGKAAEKAGEPIRPQPPPKPKSKRGALAGEAVGGALGGGSETPPPAPAATTGDTSDAAAWAALEAIEDNTLPPGAAEQLLAARKAGTPAWTMLNWARSLQQAKPQP